MWANRPIGRRGSRFLSKPGRRNDGAADERKPTQKRQNPASHMSGMTRGEHMRQMRSG